MCWRDALDPWEREAVFRQEMEEAHRAHTLVTVEARKGDNVITSTHDGRRFFRRAYFRTIVGPRDTTELLLEPGTIVIVTLMPEEVRKKFRLRARDEDENKSNLSKIKVGGPRARIAQQNGELGLSFGRTGRKLYFPLQGEDSVAFRVASLPRKTPRSL